MLRPLSSIVLLGATALFAQQTPPLPIAATGTLSGRVVAADGRAAIRNAVVDLERDGRTFTVLTASDGRFFIPSIPPGGYYLAAEKPGYTKTYVSAVNQTGTGRAGRTRLDVVAGGAIENVEIALPKAGSISGRILDDAGEPVARATVTVESVGEAVRRTATAETDDRGEYRVGGLAAGRFTIEAQMPLGLPAVTTIMMMQGRLSIRNPSAPPLPDLAPGGRSSITRASVFYPGVMDRAQAQAIEVLAGEQRAAIDFNVPAGYSNPVPAGEKTTRPGRAPERPAEIRGRVLRSDGRPLPRTQIRLESADPSVVMAGQATLSDTDGKYELLDVLPGEYMLSADKRGYIETEYGQRADSDRGEIFKVTAGEKRERTDIVLPRAGAINGRILDEYGDPVRGARVQLVRIRYERGAARFAEIDGADSLSDDIGRYRIYDVLPGQYLLLASVGQVAVHLNTPRSQGADIPGYAPTYYPGIARPSDAKWLTVGPADEIVEIDVALARVPMARISGFSYNSSGEPLKGDLAIVPSQRSTAIVGKPLSARFRAADGSFSFENVPPGEYVLQASGGRSRISAEGEFLAQYIAVNGSDIDDVVIRTTPGSVISGRVRFEGGDPPRPAEVGLSAEPVDPDLSPRFNDTGSFGAGPPPRSEVDEDWTFRIVGVHGTRRLRLTDPPAGWMLKAIYLNGSDVTDETFSFGPNDQPLANLEVVLTNQTTALEGSVTDSQGRPARSCLVVAFRSDGDPGSHPSRFIDQSVCERDGSFVIRRLPPGGYYVAAIPRKAGESNDEWQNPQTLAAIAPRSTRVVVGDGQRLALTLRVIGR